MRDPEVFWRNLRWALDVEYCHIDEAPILAAAVNKYHRFWDGEFWYKQQKCFIVRWPDWRNRYRVDLESWKRHHKIKDPHQRELRLSPITIGSRGRYGVNKNMHRGFIERIGDLLTITRKRPKANLQLIISLSNINYSFITIAQNLELIRIENRLNKRGKKIVLTEKGYDFLIHYSKLQLLVSRNNIRRDRMDTIDYLATE